ncbi:leucine-rich repeat- and IQ domain-containing protein 1 [Aplochiton taeniatus]
MVQQQELIRNLQLQMEEERREFERAQLEQSVRKQKAQSCAAIRIQAAFRGLLARRRTRAEIQRKGEEQRRCEEQQRRRREIEEMRRKEEEEEKRRKEQEERDQETRRAEYERAKEAERVRLARERKLEEEKGEERPDDQFERKEQEECETSRREEQPKINAQEARVEGEEEEKTGQEERKNRQQEREANPPQKAESRPNTRQPPMEDDPKTPRRTTEKQEDLMTSLDVAAGIPSPTAEAVLHGRATPTENTDAESRRPLDDTLQRDILVLTSVPDPLNTEAPGPLSSPPPTTTSRPTSGPAMSLPDQAEEKRLAWMRDCPPWSMLSAQNRRRKVNGAQGRRGLRRGRESNRPAPLCPDRVLQSGAWNSLQEVSTVILEDLPGCSVSTLAQCPRLQALTLRRCGLRALEGLGACGELRYIDVQENEITFVDCENLSNLQVLRLGRNRLTTVHGLAAAVNLGVLELSHNSITRIGGLEGLKKLQTLLLDHNQCISTRGLREVCTLLRLDCSHNHLTSVEGLEDCALLRSLDLRGNNLTEPPSLTNQVLLSELCLEDNSICSLEGLTHSWLPLLQLLTGARNSITELPSLAEFVSLEKLDLRHNCLSEVPNLLESLEGCAVLQEVDLTGNPLQQDSTWRSSLLKAVPSLRTIDGQQAHTGTPAPPAVPDRVLLPAGSFLGLCQAQLQQLQALQQRHRTELHGAPSSLAAVPIAGRHGDEALRLAEEHRYAHEYGHTAVTARGATPEHSPRPESAPEQGPDADPSETVKPGGAPSPSPPRNDGEARARDVTQRKGSKVGKRSPALEPPVRVVRASRARASRSSASAPQEREGRAPAELGVPPHPSSEPLHVKKTGAPDPSTAATAIQALWRGYVLRKRLTAALAAAASACSDAGEEDGLEEVDVEELVFDDTDLDNDWLTLLSDYSSSPKSVPFPDQPPRPKSAAFFPGSVHVQLPPPLPCRPKQAWMARQRVDTTRASPENSTRTKSPCSASAISGLSERSERILEEWGFSDSHTALLMLKRAQKMKSKKQRQQKLLDPTVRLALFRSQANQQAPVCPPKRKLLPEKRECLKGPDPTTSSPGLGLLVFRLQRVVTERPALFRVESWRLDNVLIERLLMGVTPTGPPDVPRAEQGPGKKGGGRTQAEVVRALEVAARQVEPGPGEPGNAEQTEPSGDRTYQWLHAQSAYPDRQPESHHFLPEIDPDVLNGGRVQLVAVAGYREGANQASGSQTNDTSTSPPHKELWQSRRNSMVHPKKEVPSPKRVTSTPSKKERISFRDNPVHTSGGWGGGKKREKVCK